MSTIKKENYHPNNLMTQPSKASKLYLLPVLIAISIVPLIMLTYIYDTRLTSYSWFSNAVQFVDVFLFYKSVAMITLLIAMASILGLSAYFGYNKCKYSPIFIPLGIYLILAILSTVFSDNRILGLTGGFEQFESIFVIISYVLLAYYAYCIVNSQEDIKYLLKGLFISATVLILLGITQITGHDFFATSLGQNLITSSNVKKVLEGFTINFDIVYLTLFNPNYVGVYVVLLAPILVILLLHSKKLKDIIIYSLLLLGLFAILVGSGSKTGFIIVAFTVFLTLILSRKVIMKYYKIVIPIGAVALLSIIGILAISKVDILGQIKSALNIEKTTPNLTDITAHDDHISITYKGNELEVRFYPENTGTEFAITDHAGNIINTTYNTDTLTYTITDERFSYITIRMVTFNNLLSFEVVIDNTPWYFTNQSEDQSYYIFNQYNKADKVTSAPSLLFSGYESFASGRGYIWSRTLPLLKDYIFLGSGADTFITVFPNNDYVHKTNYGFGDSLVSKPHNLYLQIAVHSGVISLIAFIIFYLWYLFGSIKIYLKRNLQSITEQIGAGIMMSSLGYMLASFINDSSITVAPIFWAFIGIGLAINSMVKTQELI